MTLISLLPADVAWVVNLRDPELYSVRLQRVYPYSTQKCHQATKDALSELGIELQKEIVVAGYLETKRKDYVASAYQSGQPATAYSLLGR